MYYKDSYDGKGLISDVILSLKELYKIVVYSEAYLYTSCCPPTKLT